MGNLYFWVSTHFVPANDVKSWQTTPAAHYYGEVLSYYQAFVAQDPWYVFQTSGSTGEPKTYRFSIEQIRASVAATERFFGLKPNDRLFLCINAQYVGGRMMIARAVFGQMDLYVCPPGRDFSDLMRAENTFDFIALVPLQVQNLLETTPDFFDRQSACKGIIIGGAPLNGKLAQQLAAYQCPIYATYAMTETVSHIALSRLTASWEGVFEFLPEVSWRLDAQGRLSVCAPMTANQWLETQDLVEQVGAGFRWIGRADELINTGGVKVAPFLVEQAVQTFLNAAGLVSECAVLGCDDPLLGQMVGLFLEQSVEKQLDQVVLMEKLVESLPPYHAPKKIIWVAQWPFLASGKTDRQGLRMFFDVSKNDSQ